MSPRSAASACGYPTPPYKFEVEEVYAGLFGTIGLSILFLYLINRCERWFRK